MAKLVKKRKSISSGIKINFDIPMLNALIKFMRCEFVSKVSLTNVQKLMLSLDMSAYDYNPELKDRIELIKLMCDAIIENGIRELTVLELFLSERNPDLSNSDNESTMSSFTSYI